jgi:hypothetical protein
MTALHFMFDSLPLLKFDVSLSKAHCITSLFYFSYRRYFREATVISCAPNDDPSLATAQASVALLFLNLLAQWVAAQILRCTRICFFVLLVLLKVYTVDRSASTRFRAIPYFVVHFIIFHPVRMRAA